MESKERSGGILDRAFARLFLTRGEVHANALLAPGFHDVTLQGDGLRGAVWKPGGVIQIGMTAFSARTFTPVTWDAEAGSTRIVGYEHGGGPASEWLAKAATGTTCEFFGPRAAMDLSRARGAQLVFGDETSLALAFVAQGAGSGPTRSLLEVSSTDAATAAAAAIGLAHATFVQRREDDAHLPEVVGLLDEMAPTTETFILSGKAPSIQKVRDGLKRLEIPSPRIIAKAHWAPGKVGLD